MARLYGMGPGRIPFLVKDPRGFREFNDAFGPHDAQGSANTMRGFQGGRPPLSEFLNQIRDVTLPTLIIVGDEDDSCIEASLFLKRYIATSGLADVSEDRPRAQSRGAGAVQRGGGAVPRAGGGRALGRADPRSIRDAASIRDKLVMHAKLHRE